MSIFDDLSFLGATSKQIVILFYESLGYERHEQRYLPQIVYFIRAHGAAKLATEWLNTEVRN
jgi:hypothetical protein